MELSSLCEKCGAAVGNNIMLHSLRCTGEKRKAEDEPEDRPNKKAFAPPDHATVVDLLDSDEDEAAPPAAGACSQPRTRPTAPAGPRRVLVLPSFCI